MLLCRASSRPAAAPDVPPGAPPASAPSFNKREDDFPGKKEYDDYLEEREDISEALLCSCGSLPLGRRPAARVSANGRLHQLSRCPLCPPNAVFNLTEGIEVEEMERKIREYRLANADNILQNEARRVSQAPGPCCNGGGLGSADSGWADMWYCQNHMHGGAVALGSAAPGQPALGRARQGRRRLLQRLPSPGRPSALRRPRSCGSGPTQRPPRSGRRMPGSAARQRHLGAGGTRSPTKPWSTLRRCRQALPCACRGAE